MTDAPARSDRSDGSTPPASRTVAWWAVGVAGGTLAMLVGLAGTPAWQAARSVAFLALTAGALAWSRRRGRVGGLLALVAGTVATVVGIGMGLGWAGRGAWTPTTVLALVALGAGLALLAHALRRMLAAVPGGWRLLAVPVAVLGIVVVGLPLVVAVAATNVPPLAGGAATPADRGLTYVDVGFLADDGTRLAAWWIPTSNGAAVVLRHGAGSTRDDVLAQAEVLADAGYGVLVTDARGHGGSGGDAMDLGWWGDSDLSAAVDAVGNLPGVSPSRIAVVGLSMGGEEALGALATDAPIAAVVAEGVTGRVPEDKGWLPGGPTGWLQHRMDRLQSFVADLLSAADPPTPLAEAVAARGDRPVLLIAAGEVPDEGRAATLLADAGGEGVEVWVVPGSGHTDGLATDAEGWRRRVLGFLDEAIGPAPIG